MGIDVRELIERETVNPDSIANAPLVLRQAAQVVADTAAADSDVALGGGAAEVAPVSALLSGTVMLIPIILIGIPVVMLLNFIENKLATAFSRVPWVGGGLAGYIHAAFNPTKAISDVIYSFIDHVVPNLWNDLVTVISAFASWGFTQPTSTPKGVTPAQAHQLQLEINATNERVTRLNEAIQQLSHYVHNEPIPTPITNIVTIPQQLNKVQADIGTLYDNQSKFYTELGQVVANLNKLDKDVQQLEKGLIGTRTEQLGVQDTLKSMKDTIDATKAIEQQLSGEIQTNTRSIAVLDPLKMLLEPGVPGLRNLRKLEDDPCQCPKLGNIGGDVGTALALLEFVENG